MLQSHQVSRFLTETLWEERPRKNWGCQAKPLTAIYLVSCGDESALFSDIGRQEGTVYGKNWWAPFIRQVATAYQRRHKSYLCLPPGPTPNQIAYSCYKCQETLGSSDREPNSHTHCLFSKSPNFKPAKSDSYISGHVPLILIMLVWGSLVSIIDDKYICGAERETRGRSRHTVVKGRCNSAT